LRIPRPSGALWQHADFLKLWSAQTISSFGARIAREGLPYAAVLSVHASASQVGLLAALATSPSIIVGLFGGGLIDRTARRPIMIWSDVFRAAILFAVPLAAWFHVLAMPALYVAAALIGAASMLFDIADHAYLPALITREHLLEGNTKLGITESIAEIGGPAFAGVLVQVLTAPFALAVNSVTYLVSAVFLSGIGAHEEQRQKAKATRWWRDPVAGYQTVRGNSFVWPLFVVGTVSALFGGIFSALYMIYALRTLALSPWLIGSIVAMGGIGALAGASLAGWLTRRIGIGPAILGSGLISALSAICVPLAGGPLAAKVGFMVAAQLLGDSFGVAAVIPANTLRQSVLPQNLLGRTAALFQFGSGIGRIVGALLGGALGDAVGPRETLWVAALGLVVASVWNFLTPLKDLRTLPDYPDGERVLSDGVAVPK
jgi:MFS family permease